MDYHGKIGDCETVYRWYAALYFPLKRLYFSSPKLVSDVSLLLQVVIQVSTLTSTYNTPRDLQLSNMIGSLYLGPPSVWIMCELFQRTIFQSFLKVDKILGLNVFKARVLCSMDCLQLQFIRKKKPFREFSVS